MTRRGWLAPTGGSFRTNGGVFLHQRGGLSAPTGGSFCTNGGVVMPENPCTCWRVECPYALRTTTYGSRYVSGRGDGGRSRRSPPPPTLEKLPKTARRCFGGVAGRCGDCPAWSVPDEADIAEMVQADSGAPVRDGDERHTALAAKLAKVRRYASALLGATADVQVRDGRVQVLDVTADAAVCHDAQRVHAMWLEPDEALSHPFAPLVAGTCAKLQV